MHGSELRADPPSPERRSRHSVAVRHPETGHRIENPARQLHLSSLPREGSTSHTSTDDRLVSMDRVLDHTALAKARPLVPLAPPEFSDRANVAISLLQCGRSLRSGEAEDGRPCGSGGPPRIQANSVTDTETSRACTGFASDTSWVLAPDQGLRITMNLNQQPCTNAGRRVGLG